VSVRIPVLLVSPGGRNWRLRALARENGGQELFLHQESMGKGSWSGTVRVREEQSGGALAVASFSNALVTAGTT
jgi:hypothetical protein